jgi:hypothetical protein
LKKILISFVLFCLAGSLKAQVGYNYSIIGVGLSASYIRPYYDLQHTNNNFSVTGSFIYNYSPYLPMSVELQVGKLSGGDRSRIKDAYGRESSNLFKALTLNADLQAGEFIDYSYSGFLNSIKNFYIGSGFGFVFNAMSFIQRDDLYNPGYTFPGLDKSVNIIVPFRIGYEFKLFNDFDEPQIRIDLSYQHNVTFGEGLDGYHDPVTIFRNDALDQFRQIKIGVKYNFGTITSYIKPIHY